MQLYRAHLPKPAIVKEILAEQDIQINIAIHRYDQIMNGAPSEPAQVTTKALAAHLTSMHAVKSKLKTQQYKQF